MTTSPLANLSDAELRVCGLLAHGHSNKVIARRLGLSEGTIKIHVSAIMRKTGCGNRVQVALACQRHFMPLGWVRAVDEKLVVAHLGVAGYHDSYEEADRKLNELLAWHTAVATDPAVNGGQMLMDLEQLRDFVRSMACAPVSSGVCVCGSPISGHSVGDGHAPVDVWDYKIGNWLGVLPPALIEGIK